MRGRMLGKVDAMESSLVNNLTESAAMRRAMGLDVVPIVREASPMLFDADTTIVPDPLAVVNIAPGADLILEGFAMHGGLAAGTGEINLTGAVSNSGDTDAGSSEILIYLSQDAQNSPDDTLLRSFRIAELDSGDLIDFEVVIVLSAVPEDGERFFISVRVDSANEVVESDKGNNAPPPQEFSFEAETNVAVAANIELYILLVRAGLALDTTYDLAALGTSWRVGEVVTQVDLETLRADFLTAGIRSINYVSLSQSQAMSSL